ncbi:MAG: tRNA pseudouridine(13) synthase TruD [Acidobacteriota bacterium]
MLPRIRTTPEDFFVEERLLYPPAGDGAHLYLQIEKRLCNTDDVARSLAQALDLPRRDIGYAGRKDRIAVTRQWFSLPRSAAKALDGWQHPGVRIVARQYHHERLRVGQLQGNRFRLIVRDGDAATARAAVSRLAELARRGLPNRFGSQRFGRDGRNAARGAKILRAGRVRGNRRTAWLMVSALQSAVFNRVLELRRAALDEMLLGDVAYNHATGEVFLVNEAVDAELLRRFELSPTGPMFGTKMKWPRGETARIEQEAMKEFELPDPRRLDMPRGLRLFGDRRPLRVQPKAIEVGWSEGVLHLGFELPAGSYATVLLEELLPAGFLEGPGANAGEADPTRHAESPREGAPA